MRALVISDLHSNAEALRAVLSRVQRKKFEHIICLGDFVGYGAQPNQVLDSMRTLRGTKIYIRGNHDRVASGIDDGTGFNPAAKEAAVWTRSHLSAPNRRFLEKLTIGPIQYDGLMICHGSPYDEDEYVFTEHHAAQIFVQYDAPIILYGHTHLPVVFWTDERRMVMGTLVREEATFRLDPSRRYLINPGSVGQPRDRNPEASCAIFDSDRMTVQFFRVPYDYTKTQAAIIKAGLPRALADRLEFGT
ncbi:MAG TPA: metallophosphoesterase family protein [Thermoanaerobaculia bacterium]|nr:metallophosphoesterase family protein [Thermoanaerobaculia bacterium]